MNRLVLLLLLILFLASCAAPVSRPALIGEPKPVERQSTDLSTLLGDRQMEEEAYHHSWFAPPTRRRCNGGMVLPVDNLDVPPLRIFEPDPPVKAPDYGLYANPIR